MSTVCSLTLLHIIPLICLAYLNYAIFWAIRLLIYHPSFPTLFTPKITRHTAEIPKQEAEQRPCGCHCSHQYCWCLHPLSQPQVCHQHDGVVDCHQRSTIYIEYIIYLFLHIKYKFRQPPILDPLDEHCSCSLPFPYYHKLLHQLYYLLFQGDCEKHLICLDNSLIL